MMRYVLLIVAALLGTVYARAQDLVGYVQPLAGTAPATTPAAQKHSEAGSEKNANTIPAAGLPFGMTQWTPQTRNTEDKCVPPYFYNDTVLTGFRASHWINGSCMQDYGSMTIMPVTSHLRTERERVALSFSHKDEVCRPDYYAVDLRPVQLRAEVTATKRCGMFRFTMDRADSLYLLVTPNSDEGEGFVRIDAAKGEIWGYNPVHRIYQGLGQRAGFSGYFFIKFEKANAVHGVFAGGVTAVADCISNQHDIGAYVGWKLQKGEQLVVRVGTSFTSVAGAKRNLEQEMPAADFEIVRKRSAEAWQKALEQVKIETADLKAKRTFYTALYHSFQHPRLYNDVDGKYPRFAGNYKPETKTKGNYYDDFSMWDIYRAQLPLLEILQPELVNDLVQSLVLKGQQGGWLPIFPCWNNYTAAMIGDHSTAFIASAFSKGIRNYDVSEAYRLMRQNAFNMPPQGDYINGKGRRGLTSYLQYGYIPLEDTVPYAFHKNEQVSRTLEYAYDDYALSLVAEQLNKQTDAAKLMQRALSYKKVFDTTAGMMRGRHADGTWASSFHPDQRQLYITEGTPRQYSFYVPHDVTGLTKLMGGTGKLEAALDSLFLKGEYWHGNEPCHQIPFMYNFTGSPWKTQREVYKILTEEYSDGPGGLSGNDDAGQMSAWYVFASLGLYPLDPVGGEHQLTAPLFDQGIIQLGANKTLTIRCKRKSKLSIYIAKVRFNGQLYRRTSIGYAQLMKGGLLEFELVDKPPGVRKR